MNVNTSSPQSLATVTEQAQAETSQTTRGENSAAAYLLQQRRKSAIRVAEVRDTHRIRGILVALLIMALLTAAGIWAARTPLDEIAIAQGKVIPAGDNRVVQHLEGGIITQILIKEGDIVSQGQPLFHIELGTSSLDIERINTQLAGLAISRLRLLAEVQGQPHFQLPKRYQQQYSDLASTEEDLFRSNQRVKKTSLQILGQQLEQKKLSIQEIEQSIDNNQTQRTGQSDVLKILQNQFDIGTVSRVELLQAKLRLQEIEGTIEEQRKSLERVQREVSEIQIARQQETEKFRIIALQELQEKEENIATLKKTVERAGAQNERTIINSPITGVVKSLAYTTEGNVIKPGEILAEIVPTINSLIIEAQLLPIDRGFVAVGQEANIKLETFDYSRYGGLQGEVSLIGASSITTDRGLSYFEIQVTPEKTYLGINPGDLEISPGMVATVDIITGSRTVMEFLLKPIFKLREEAFRER